MGRNTIFSEIMTDTLKSDLELLENLSKKISDLIYINEFSEIPEIDNHRKALLKKITENDNHKKIIKQRIGKLVDNNVAMVRTTEKKLHKLSKNHYKFNNRLEAYSINNK